MVNINAIAVGWALMMIGIIFMTMGYSGNEGYFIFLMLAVINVSAGAQHMFRIGFAKQ